MKIVAAIILAMLFSAASAQDTDSVECTGTTNECVGPVPPAPPMPPAPPAPPTPSELPVPPAPPQPPAPPPMPQVPAAAHAACAGKAPGTSMSWKDSANGHFSGTCVRSGAGMKFLLNGYWSN